MKRKDSWSVGAATAAMSLLALSACATDTGEVRLGVNVAPITAAATAAADARTAAGLAITRVRLLVNTAKVGYAGGHGGGMHGGCKGGPGSGAGGSGGNASGASGDMTAVGPFVVDLTADEIASGAQRSFSLGQLAAGTYGGAEIEIDVPDADADPTADPTLADFVSQKASVLVDGTFDGTTFQFSGHFLAEQGTDGDVTIDASTPFDLAMSVDPSSWFLDANGAVIDPTDASQHATIAAAICKSLDTQPVVGGHAGGKPHCVEAAP